MTDDIQPLVDHLTQQTGLPPGQTQRPIEDVLAWFATPVEDWVKARHAQLQAAGVRNSAIFEQIARELPARRFAPTPLSTRQIRRLIYG